MNKGGRDGIFLKKSLLFHHGTRVRLHLKSRAKARPDLVVNRGVKNNEAERTERMDGQIRIDFLLVDLQSSSLLFVTLCLPSPSVVNTEL